MPEREISLLESLRMAMGAEQAAAEFYSGMAQRSGDTVGRHLLEQLADFERYHYSKLVELEKSLREKGAFIAYEGRELAGPVASEVQASPGADQMSLMGLVTLAMDAEETAEKKYAALAKRTADPAGQAMFKRLAAEERTHRKILWQAYWSLNDYGVWAGPGYGAGRKGS